MAPSGAVLTSLTGRLREAGRGRRPPHLGHRANSLRSKSCRVVHGGQWWLAPSRALVLLLPCASFPPPRPAICPPPLSRGADMAPLGCRGGRDSRGGRLSGLGLVAVVTAVAAAAASLVAAVPPRNVCLAAGGGGSGGGGSGGGGGAAAASCGDSASAPSGGGGDGSDGGATLPTTARVFSATDFAGIYTARIPSVGACPTTIVHTSNGGPPPFAIPSTFSLPASLTVDTNLPTSAIPLPTVSTVYLRHQTTAMDGSVCGPADGGLLLTSSTSVPADQRELIFVAAASALEGQGRPLPDSVRNLKDQLSDFWVGVETSGRVCGGGSTGVFPAGTTVAFLQEDRTVTAGLLRFSSGFKYMVVVHNPTELTCVYRAKLVDEVSTFAANPPATPTPLPTSSPSPSPTAPPDVEEETADASGQAVEDVGDGEDGDGVGGGLIEGIVNSGEDSKDRLAESGIQVVGSVLSTLLTVKEPSPSPTAVPVVASSPVVNGGDGGGGGAGAPSSPPSETATATQPPATGGGGDAGEGGQPTTSGVFLDSTASESPACFPGDALVTTAVGDMLRMADVGLSTVLAAGPDKAPAAVYFFSHRQADTPATTYSRLQVAGSVLELTPGHLVPLFGSGRLVSAATLAAGDELISANGTAVRILSTSRVVRTGAGLYNPHTAAGQLVVGGLLVSCYTTAVDVRAARVGLSLVRAAAAAGVASRWRAAGMAEGGGWALHRLVAALSSGA